MNTSGLIILVGIVTTFLSIVKGQGCGAGLLLTYVKIPNIVPRTAFTPTLIYSALPGVAITAECYNRCQQQTDCDGFMVDYRQGACFKVSLGRQYEDLIPTDNVNFFRKVCLKVPHNCTTRAWPVEYIPNHELLGNQHTVISNIRDKWQCAQLCLDQSNTANVPPCRSSQYQAWSATCTLSQYDSHTSPDSFVATAQYNVDYMENQCVPETNNISCWTDPIANRTSFHSDLEIYDLSQNQCESRCKTEKYFRCMAYTFQCPTGANRTSRCVLHSDSSLTEFSTNSLIPQPCSIYRERIACVDLSVSCAPNSMLITLREKAFSGHLFVLGHSQQCGTTGNNQDVLSLMVPLPETNTSQNKCDVMIKRAISNVNRTLASAVIVVQKHKLIQTASDRVVKVTCLIAENGTLSPVYNNLTLSAGFSIRDPSVQSTIQGYGENVNSSYPPNARLRIIDVSRGGRDASVTDLGAELELRIDVDPPYNVSMLRAGHLIASSGSGQDSLLLLDSRGCPPDPTTFPAVTAQNSTTLVAKFRAFKFPDSMMIRFSLVLTFCQTVCQPTDCGNGLNSYGKRKKRDTEDIVEEMPLQLVLIVREINERKNVEAPTPRLTEDEKDLFMCASFGNTVLVAVGWVALQFILLIACCCALGRRERQSDQVSLQSDFNPRQVSWADHLNSTKLNPGFVDETRTNISLSS